jgi:hypothetical protein
VEEHGFWANVVPTFEEMHHGVLVSLAKGLLALPIRTVRVDVVRVCPLPAQHRGDPHDIDLFGESPLLKVLTEGQLHFQQKQCQTVELAIGLLPGPHVPLPQCGFSVVHSLLHFERH